MSLEHVRIYICRFGMLPMVMWYVIIGSYIAIANMQTLSLSTLVLNSRDQQGKLWLPNILENNLTITCPSNTGHKSFSTKLLAP